MDQFARPAAFVAHGSDLRGADHLTGHRVQVAQIRHLSAVEHTRHRPGTHPQLGADFVRNAAMAFTPPHALVRLILGARVASAAGDAGLRARVLQATEVLERERPAVPLLAAVAGYARGILERDAQALMAAADALRSSSRPLLYASAAEHAGGGVRRAQRTGADLDPLNAAFDTYIAGEATADARRVGRALRRLGV